MTFAIHLQRTTVRPCIKLFIWFCYMFTKDTVIIYLFSYKGRRHYFPFCLQMTAVLVFCCSFAKDHSPCAVAFILKGRCPFLCCSFAKDRCPCICYSFAKDHCPCLVLFICKGPLLSLSGAIYLQRTVVLILCYSSAKDPPSLSYVIHLQRTAVLVLCYSFAKDRGTYFVPLVCRESCCSCYSFVVPAR